MAYIRVQAIAPKGKKLNSYNSRIGQNGGQRKDEDGDGAPQFVNSAHFVFDDAATPSPKLIGSDLGPADYAALEARWIDRDLADAAGLRRVDSLTGGELVGRKGGNYAGIAIPYFHPGSNHVREYRLRRDQPDFEYDAAGNLKPRQKYLSAPGRANMLYVVRGIDRALLHNPELTIVVTEGEFKTLALRRLANFGVPHCLRFLPVGLSGVYNWRGTIGKTTGPNGARLDVKGAIPDLDWIVWQNRRVIIAYDADAITKEPVRIARSELAANLRPCNLGAPGFKPVDAVRSSAFSNGRSRRERESMTTSPSLVRMRCSTRSHTLITPVHLGGKT